MTTRRTARAGGKITDRAKRYRANTAAEAIDFGRPKRCHYCGLKQDALDIEHVDGDEANGARKNIGLSCRPCNVLKGLAFKKAGRGKKTAQYNPEGIIHPHPRGARSWQQYITAALTLKGEGNGMNLAEAIDIVQNTPHAKRTLYAAVMNNPAGAETLGAYMAAIAKHTRHAHDEGGQIIHDTPKSRRREFASEIHARRASHGTNKLTGGRPRSSEEVPF